MKTPKRIIFASGNEGKWREMQTLLFLLGVDCLLQKNFQVSSVEETGRTFIENAIIKARHASQQTGMPAIADDSGLVVDALQGAPGVYSARYAGKQAAHEKNMDLLLKNMEAIKEGERTARFYCVLTYLNKADDPTPIIAEGVWEGKIARSPAGDGGFGYDPIFIPQSMTVSAAQLSSDEKNQISHRAQASRELIKKLKKLFDHE